jgi:hypothetical protein
VTTASNEFEADIILGRLEEAGIHAWESNSLGGPAGSAGPRDIYVEDAEVEKAKEALRQAQDVDAQDIESLAEDGVDRDA